ncbi:16S rRNA (guanine(966)-N(2))-methyltransferase RsmD [Herbaspirillum sp. Sphag1AN]|uniref:16S rRNA (guanine(966)-N(2))-methyltransferase RsmD n=1 Tax=unclassified Herbaspirillum TaxID=2624150 RepID=UPI00161B4233|nr:MULTISPECIES: 16S rRNA (guanine(966)-N(2))-methyltransferase RsmD [unclassified Herbaspirillum]MBB3212629.1 16S rRNA (guanine(966)-N(2))-methyltransferase RsmD [Herbaspirillum sp. Sphag1AN]MBB3245826.1 16S rRNA (guanine(966)-N(2))-methyltransferase RsmD [Herbaspirillum sp. Sphag64]
MSRTVRKYAAPTPAPARVLHQVRIIGGQWKRTPLPVVDAEGLRPTPDRVRETVFNWITHLIDGDWGTLRCLDLFAGTGALGFETASRGAASVEMVEQHTPAVRQLQMNKDKLQANQVEILRGDALALLQGMLGRSSGQRYDLIFADPPYHLNWLSKIMPLCQQLLAPQGLMYVESEFALDGDDAPEWMAAWEIVRADKAGMVFYHLLRRKNIG